MTCAPRSLDSASFTGANWTRPELSLALWMQNCIDLRLIWPAITDMPRVYHLHIRTDVRQDGSPEEGGLHMADKSAIEWTEATWNPTTGCDQISTGCDNCYALALAKRLKAMGSSKYQTDGDPRTSGPGFGVAVHPDSLDVPRRWRDPRVVFVNSMSDLFHARVPLDYIEQVFQVMLETPRHTYQVLTKRAARLAKLAPRLEWPDNLWMGVSVENRDHVDRIDHLRAVPAAVKFVSAEPLLGPLGAIDLTAIDWLIAGGESGRLARPMDPTWVRSLRDQCLSSGTAFFFKQWGGRTPKAGGRTLDGHTWSAMPTQRDLAIAVAH